MTGHLDRANALFVDEEFTEALSEYTLELQTNGLNADVLLKRSACYQKLGNLKDAINDCDNALALDPTHKKASLRKGVLLFGAERYEEARAAFAPFVSDPTFAMHVRKCDACIQMAQTSAKSVAVTLSKSLPSPSPAAATSSTSGPHSAETNSTPSPVPSSSPLAQSQPEKKPNRFTHEWYQSDSAVTVTILARGLKSDQVTHEFTSHSFSVSINLTANDTWTLDLDLCDEIIPESSTVTVGTTKVELRLKKARPVKWLSLEQTNSSAYSTAVWADTSKMNKHAYPSSSQKKKDWDELDHQVAQEDKDEKVEGDAALQKLFRDIYSKADEDTRRAMNKSYVESGGTVLSTNWKDVGSRKVEGSPPSSAPSKD
eukprot:c98_g1_i2.p1 GENE.c98_g1_i2~~c98_g1_i2.p1  ORF type:complete len:380 (+),score=93.83 c98_g1_i2:26-1141(+)